MDNTSDFRRTADAGRRRLAWLLMGVAALLLAACGSSSSTTAAGGSPAALGPVPASAIQGIVYDVNFNPIAGATVTLSVGLTAGTVQTDAAGQFRLTGLADGTYTVTISRTGYQTLVYSSVPVSTSAGADLGVVTMVVVLTSGQYRVVLTWGANPSDLDLHACTPNGVEIYFGNQSDIQAPELSLDVDDTSSFGPETMTLTALQTGVYAFWVHNYSGYSSTSISNSGAHVEFRDVSGLLAFWDVPPNSTTEDYWQVFKLDSTTPTVPIMSNLITVTDPSLSCSSTSPPFSYSPTAKAKPLKRAK